MFWRVFGPAWQRDEIDYQLNLMRAAGVGGVMTSFFYPVALDDPASSIHNQALGSPEFLDTFRYAAGKAHALGMGFGVFGGSGWPFGGPTVAPEDAAHRLRRVAARWSGEKHGWVVPALARGEHVVAAFADGREVHGGRGATGASVLPGSEQSPLQFFVSSPTGMQVKRPALGGEGLVVDHYRSDAARRYLDSVVAPMLSAAPGRVDRLFCDSLEVYNANWTDDFPAQFRRRRGYDIVSRLPALFGGGGPDAARLRFDFWRSLAELTEERFTRVVGGWARAHGTTLEMEAYGTPPNPLTAARFIDVPCGEQYEWQGFSMSRMAASGAHLAGRNIIGAEAWTWTSLPNRLIDSLRTLKLASDIHFLAGCNDLIGVDFPYSPRHIPPPGWLPYYGPVMNQNNPQWPFFHGLAEYVNRCQWMLRQGRPVARVALYLPVEDVFAHGPLEQMLLDFHLRDRFASGEKTGEFGLASSMRHHSDLIHTLLTHGYNYDGIDFWSLDRMAKVRDGKLVCGDGEYSTVVLPNLEAIEAGALAKLSEFVRSGGTLIAMGGLPSRVYGARKAEAESAVAAMLTGSEPDGRGRVYTVMGQMTELEAVLSKCGPDVVMEPYQPKVGFVRRRAAGRNIYFFANMDDAPTRFMADFAPDRTLASELRDSRLRAYYFDPLTGRVELDAMGYTGTGRPTQLPIELAAHGSIFVVLDQATPGSPPLTREVADSRGAERARPLSSAWRVTFDGPDAPPPHETSVLESWTAWPGAQSFSGQGAYTTRFTWSEPIPKNCKLRFESVHEAGEVFVNGRSAGLVWAEPFEVEIAPLLKAGTNEVRVVVGNLPVNRFIGLPAEDLGPLRAKYGSRFPAPEEKRLMKGPAESGLIGRVWLVTKA